MYLVIKPFKIKNKLFSPGKMVKLSQEKASYLIKQGFIDKVKNKTTNKPNYIVVKPFSWQGKNWVMGDLISEFDFTKEQLQVLKDTAHIKPIEDDKDILISF